MTGLSVLDETKHTFNAIQWSFDFEGVTKQRSNLPQARFLNDWGFWLFLSNHKCIYKLYDHVDEEYIRK